MKLVAVAFMFCRFRHALPCPALPYEYAEFRTTSELGE